MILHDTFNRPLETLRISLTDRCNFRCTYCMPADQFPGEAHFLPHKQLLTFDEITRLVTIFSQFNVQKIRLTGGEPLVRAHVETLIQQIARIDGIRDISMTTNGYLLSQKARKLRDAGLDRLNVSLDSLDEAVFRRMNGGRAEVKDVLRGIEAAENAGFSPIKVNAVIQKGVNDHTLVDLAMYFRQRGHIVRFIEYMDAGTVNGWRTEYVLTADELISRIVDIIPLKLLPPNYEGEVARRFQYADGTGEVGFITSVSKPFCGGCNRLRLSADGILYACLFARDGVDLRELMRTGASDEQIADCIATMWRRRTDRYSEERSSMKALDKVEMYRMGG